MGLKGAGEDGSGRGFAIDREGVCEGLCRVDLEEQPQSIWKALNVLEEVLTLLENHEVGLK